jgi:hypothetical protein
MHREAALQVVVLGLTAVACFISMKGVLPQLIIQLVCDEFFDSQNCR